MIDQIYTWFSVKDFILLISILINIGIAIDYFERKMERRNRRWNK